ncbi:hypothetical protein NL108_010416 [Boleophthalmus pectinirostris]|uniref:monocarboxylate transporter 2 n=1 Tax=Boleophthalmus pectinirostris TaxID=150288 RepID=UPI00242E070B|nr:monocarboxylate transporter 2 [Boleophthalmus pectinirostris]KAJ0069586.1 hypothetical protein NL108_010416 [Boleophthalmus pectinirostris]
MGSSLKKQGERGETAPGPAAETTVQGDLDGGYAWIILLSAFTMCGLTFGVIKSFGVFYVEIHRYFDTTATTVSWITSITLATIHVSGPLSSALSARFGHRSIVMIGGLLCSIGVISGSFARNLLELYLTTGFLNGLGYSLAWTPTVTMVGLYFDRKRPMANALSSSGECVLMFVISPLTQWLIDSYTWRGAMLIVGALQLNLCICGALLRPLENSQQYSHPKEVTANEEEKMLRNQSQSLHKEDKNTLKSKILHYLDFTLIANAKFMLYAMFGLFAAMGLFAPALFLVPYARSRGVEEYQSAALMSISSALDLIGRVGFGWVANMRIIKTLYQLIATVIVLGVVVLLCPLASTFSELVIFSAAFGLVYGATLTVHITVLAEVVGVHRLGSALGFAMLIRSCGGLLGPPIAGFFIDHMGDYGAGFLMAGAAFLISSLFLILLALINYKDQGSGLKAKPSHNVEEEEAEVA